MPFHFTFEPEQGDHWHGWTNDHGRFLLSNETTKRLYEFSDVEAAINELYTKDVRAARALHNARKEYVYGSAL